MDQTIITSKSQISEIVAKEVEASVKKALGVTSLGIKEEKISQFQAASILEISLPTLNKLVKEGRFTQHSIGRKKFFIKSQLLDELKTLNP